MSGDYTRFTYTAIKDYAAVLKQQGRVDLDADWNELVAIFDRRWRAETIDIMGRCIVPEYTKNAFNITPTGPGAFTIGIGRMYVDGLVAENHGKPPATHFDEVLGEQVSQTEVSYSDQPYLPSPLPPPLAGANGTTDLVYIQVWEREIDAIEDPDIREKALGGPDTCNRVQTAWQVKVLQNVGQHACGDDIPAWDNLIAPSAGRLTTSAVAPPASTDPCIISQSGGYRGLENRLYRVQITVPGGVGTAKFTWSRDNGSVTTSVTAISGAPGPYQVTVGSLGRDQVLRFQIGDWVEISDDYLEFQRQAGVFGTVTEIDQANNILTLSFANPNALSAFDPTNAGRHTRARRWDAKNGVDANGQLTTGAGPMDIEDGIQVAFSLDPAESSNQFYLGDYWVFSARTADGSVEILTQAPPRGILDHFCRLGFIEWGPPPKFDNCREFWPPACSCNGCCTVTVGDGVNSQGEFTDIQAAIDSLGPAGGEVCLGRGVFMVTKSILIGSKTRNVTVRGMGWATKVIFAPGANAADQVLFDVQNTSEIILESFFAVARSARSIVRFTGTQACIVRDTALINLNISAASIFGLLGASADRGTISGRAIEFLETCTDSQIERNTLIAAKAIAAGAPTPSGLGEISGTAAFWLSPNTKIGIAGATVTWTNSAGTSKNTVTDNKGQYDFPSLPAGDYTVAVAANGFKPVQQSATVVADSTTAVDFRLFPLTGAGARRAAASSPSVNTRANAEIKAIVNQIGIRENRVLALLSSVFLSLVKDCDIIDNQLWGLSAETLQSFGAGPLTKDNIDQLQDAVLVALSRAPSIVAFQGAAIVLGSGTRVTIAENTMVGLLGLAALLLSEARIKDNQVLALLGLLVIDGFLIRLSGNYVAGLLAGWMQAGLLVDFESSSNLWLGLYGVMFLPLALFQKTFGPLFGAALESAGFATNGATVAGNAFQSVSSIGANLSSLGVVALAKIHHEVFFTFLAGVVSQQGVISGDVTISDSSFEFCSQAGVSWQTLPAGNVLGNLLQPIHVVERNTMNVSGIGVICQCVDGSFRGNTIRCPATGLDLTCEFTRVLENSVDATTGVFNVGGLITVRSLNVTEELGFVRISGNRLQGGQVHGILIAGNLNDLVVENNLIRGMGLNGITAADDSIFVRSGRISGNQITGCQGIKGSSLTGGAIVLSEVQNDLLVHGNQLLSNGGIGMWLNPFAQAGESVLRLRIQDNSQDGDGSTQMVSAGGYMVQFIGNQCTEPQTFAIAVILTGSLVIANGNTVYAAQPSSAGVASLLLWAAGGVTPPLSAIATSNILSGAPQSFGFVNFVAANNVAL
jgi:Family of unknown function (DUF6519)/Carboxypeptidase regulatory-like domain/Right handed beta helix region